jgi:hypothetical protein
MHIAPATIFAAPRTPEMFGQLRDGIEASVNEHNRQPTPFVGHMLTALQAGFRDAIERDGIDVAPLARRIHTGEVMA